MGLTPFAVLALQNRGPANAMHWAPSRLPAAVLIRGHFRFDESMTQNSDERSDPESQPAMDEPQPTPLPEGVSLPPVEPPSAGFIVQLFVVPALIVAAVIGVYLLFGRLASSDADWRELVVDLRSTNPHTRWRGANGLAQLLQADALRSRSPAARTPEHPLADDPELATELAQTLTLELGRTDDHSEEHQRLVEYLVKSLGWMDVPEVVLPTLQQSLSPRSDAWLRQQSLIAVGMVAGRALERQEPIEAPDLVAELIAITRDDVGVLRHLATYDLGFFPDDEAQKRLATLMSDTDRPTRLNAAVGRARQGSLDALPVFQDVLKDAARQNLDPAQVQNDEQATTYFERTQQVANALTATRLLAAQFTPEQRAGFLELVTALEDTPNPELRQQVFETLQILRNGA